MLREGTMRGCRCLPLLLVWTVLGGGQAASAAQPIEVRGRVVDSVGAPIRGAEVRLIRRGTPWHDVRVEVGEDRAVAAEGTTTGDGSYLLMPARPGEFVLRIRSRGLREMSVDLERLVESRSLAAVELPSETLSTVRLVDHKGMPVAGARVRLTVDDDPGVAPNRERQAASPAPVRAESDDRGAVVLAMPAGSVSGQTSHTVKIEVVADGFLPQVTGALAGSLDGLRIGLTPAARQTVLVRGLDGRPLPRALIQPAGSEMDVAWSGDDGTVELPVPVSSSSSELEETVVRYVARGPANGRKRFTLVGPGAVGDRPERARVQLEGRTLRARVLDVAGQPIEGALVWARGQGSTVTGGDGTAELPTWWGADAVQERQGLNAAAAGYRWSSALVADPRRESEVVIRLESTWQARVAVRGRDGAPVSGAEVVAYRAGDPWAGTRGALRAWSDEQGVARLLGFDAKSGYDAVVRATGFVPKRFEIARPPAAETGSDPAWRGKPSTLEVVLDSARSLVGWVEDEAGVPVVGAKISILPETSQDRQRAWVANWGVPPVETWSGEDGSFVVSDLAWGSYDFVARAPGFAAARIRGVELSAEGESELGTIVLSPGLRLEGRVVDERREPIAGATVVAAEASSVRRPFGAPAEDEPSALAAEDGRFVVEDLAAVAYQLRVSAPGFAAVGVDATLPVEDPVEVQLLEAVLVEGTTVDQDGEPVEGVRLQLMPQRDRAANFIDRPRRVTSDAEGRFDFGQIPPQEYAPLISAPPGWVSPALPRLRVSPESGAVGWPVDEAGGLRLVFDKGVSLTGTVRLHGGEPAAEASLGTRIRSGDITTVGETARTDAQGRYRFSGVRPGEVEINVHHPDAVSWSGEVQVPETGGVHDFVLEPAYAVSGRVLSPDGEPVANATIALRPVGGGFSSFGARSPTSGADGTFEVRGKAAGEYVLSASHEQWAAASTEPIIVQGDVEGLEVVLGGGGTVQGRVLGLEGDRVTQVGVRARRIGGAARYLPGFELQTQPDYEGVFRFDRVPEGRWVLSASEPFDQRAVQAEIEVLEGATLDEDLEFRDGLVLSGTVVRDAVPLAGLTVRLVHRQRSFSATDESDASGGFRFGGLEPGLVVVTVERRGLVVSRRELVLEADQELSLEVGAAVVAGSVLDRAGTPIEVASVRLHPEGADVETWGGGTTSDSRGRWRLEDVAGGRYVVTASADGYSGAQQAVDVPPNGEVEVVLNLEKGRTLHLRPITDEKLFYLSAYRVEGDRVFDWSSPRVSAEGVAELDGAPEGAQHWLVGHRGVWTEVLLDRLPEEPVPVRLPRAVPVVVEVPRLRELGLRAEVRFVDANGQSLIVVERGRTLRRVLSFVGQSLQHNLPLGEWTVEVRSLDGEFTASQRFEVSAPAQRLVVDP